MERYLREGLIYGNPSSLSRTFRTTQRVPRLSAHLLTSDPYPLDQEVQGVGQNTKTSWPTVKGGHISTQGSMTGMGAACSYGDEQGFRVS